MKILITFALDTEFASWRSMLPFRKIPGDLGIYEARLGDSDLRVFLTGVGGVSAQGAIRAALKWKPDACISAGLAGSLRAEIPVGQICAAGEILELETGRSVKTDPQMLCKAEMQGASLIGRLLSSAKMVITAAGKSRLGRIAEAVEMESFATISEATANGVPAAAIRAISDAADEDLPIDFERVLDGDGNVRVSKVVVTLAGAPHKLPGVIRLARNSRHAARSLAEFLSCYVAGLADSPESFLAAAGTKRA